MFPEATAAGAGPGAENLNGHSDALAAQLALQSYYMPVLGGMQELFKTDPDAPTPTLSLTFAAAAAARELEEDGPDADYVDHLQQHGNTKKRKVPANLGASARDRGDGGREGADDEEPMDRAIPTGRLDDYDNAGAGHGGGGPLMLDQKRMKVPRATLAGLSHKEMLRSRKRQLATVLGALTQGDTLVLDQALSANYPFSNSSLVAEARELIRVRPSRRRVARLARAYKSLSKSVPADVRRPPLPSSEFPFAVHSATSDRLVATKEEVANLHARFEAELTHQAVRATEAAKQTAAVLNGNVPPPAKRPAKSTQAAPPLRATDATAKPKDVEQSLLGTPPPKTGKKKKRSALANASNPHHLRNYVPSRLPHQAGTNAAQNVANAASLISPLPVRFLSADVPPRRSKAAPTTPAPAPVTALANPTEEWICPFCEYDLFFGDSAAYQRAIASRKKILRRRRRARERAAAAASGTSAATAKNPPPPPQDDGAVNEAPYPPTEPAGTTPSKQARSKGVQNERSGVAAVQAAVK